MYCTVQVQISFLVFNASYALKRVNLANSPGRCSFASSLESTASYEHALNLITPGYRKNIKI